MLDISFGLNRTDVNWKPTPMEWDAFVEVLRRVRRTDETMEEFDHMDKTNKDKIKNGKAFVGGLVKGGRRKKGNIINRWLITLDADNADEYFADKVAFLIGQYAYVLYSTHSSRPNKLKYRLVCPVDHAICPDQYAAVSRKIAYLIGMHYFDKTTYDVHRLMYLPSCSKDAKEVFIENLGPPVDVDYILGLYIDWHNPAEWPRHIDEDKDITASLKVLGNPKDKQGTIGQFCNVYGMVEGIEKFLFDVYEATGDENRWTFRGGSSFGGMRIYDNSWAYSEHQSDPANTGHCLNIFDLVRIHKFGFMDKDVKEHTPITKYPSYQAMMEFVANDPEVKKALMQEIRNEFQILESDEDLEDSIEFNPKTTLPYPTAKNAEILLRCGEFKGILAYDAFGNTEVIRGPLPWRGLERPLCEYEPWLGADDNRLEHYFDKKYEFKSAKTLRNAFTEVVHMNAFHPIKEYLNPLTWDGTQRIDRMMPNYLGADDTHYVRSVTRIMFVAAVKRIYEPGCKFDEMLVLVGPQGSGKSSILAKLGRKWFSDSLRSFENKEAGEHLQNGWIFEISELSAMKKSEVEEVKAFISKTDDRYRVAYDRQVSEFPRKCVFIGTTNNRNFLKDTTGNRRFLPVNVDPTKAIYNHWEHLTDAVIDQIWAEALYLYNAGESIRLDQEATMEAERQQQRHMEQDTREGIIQEWLESPVQAGFPAVSPGELRKRVCATQILIECLGSKLSDLRPHHSKEICDIMRKMPGWKELEKRVRVDHYGQQTAFERVDR